MTTDARSIAFDGGEVELRGALDLHATGRGLLPRRLPAWTRAQHADALIDTVATCTSGVRLAMRTDSPWVELDVHPLSIHLGTRPFVDPAFDLVVGDRAPVLHRVGGGSAFHIDPLDAANITFTAGDVQTVRFVLEDAGDEDIEIWFPTSASCELVDLRIAGAASIGPPVERRRRWLHHGSSISHCMDVDRPTDAWPYIAAAAGGVELVNLGFAGQCQLDPFVARTIRDHDADLISLKLGINLMNAASMTIRTFGPAVHGFLDTVREGHPTTPVLVISPIWCPLVESHGGPTVARPGGVYGTVDLPQEVAANALTTERIRTTLAAIVAARRADGDDHLHLLDGDELLGPDDDAHLYDRLHPDPAGYRLMGERFAAKVLAAGGILAS